jgi:hypothetical protein
MTLKLGEALGSEPSSSIFNCVCQRSSNNEGVWCFLLLEKRVMITFLTQSIPTGAQVCESAKIFFTSKFSYVLFCNPTHKTETETTNRWGTSNSKPLGLIIMMGQSKILSSCQMLFISLLYRVTQILRLLPVMASCAIMLIENNFPEPNWHILSFLHPILLRRITYWAPLEMLLERGPCIYTYKQGCKSIHKSTKNVDANVNTQKENQDNQNRSNEVEDVML